MVLITKVEEEGPGRFILTAQLLRVTKFCAVPSNRSSQDCWPLLPVKNPSEGQLSPVTRTDRSIEV